MTGNNEDLHDKNGVNPEKNLAGCEHKKGLGGQKCRCGAKIAIDPLQLHAVEMRL